MSNFDKAVSKRATEASRLKETYKVATLAQTDVNQRFVFQAYMQNIDRIYEDFKKYHNTIIGLLPDDKDFAEHDTIRLEADKVYFGAKAVFLQLFPPAVPAVIASPSLSPSKMPNLPKISIPKFDGHYKTWSTFIDLFNSVVHKNVNLSNIEKFHYLAISLINEPLSLVKTVPMTDDNYQIAYDTLIKRYENKRFLATNYYNDIFNSPAVQRTSSQELRRLLDIFSENLAALRSLQFPVDQWDFLLFNLLLNKIDTKTRTEFEIKHSAVDIPSYNQLFKFLENNCRALEAVQILSVNPTKPKQCNQSQKSHSEPNRKNYQTSSFVASTSQQNKKCLICGDFHSLYRCPEFLAKQTSERFAFVKNHNLCINCLSSTHLLRNCLSQTKCRTCHTSHHTLLHRETSNKIEEQPTTSPNNANNISLQSSINLNSSLINQTVTVMLSTAIINIRDSKGNFQTARALFDSGSMANFISRSCAKRLGLPYKQVAAEIEGLNNMTSSESLGVTRCFIKPQLNSDEHTFDFEAIILPKICCDQPKVVLDPSQWSHIQHLQLADKSCHLPSSVDMLIGVELLPYIFGQNRVFGTKNQPVAHETVFGFVLQGRASAVNSINTNLTSLHATIDTSLDKCLQKFWEIESICTKPHVSPEDKQCESYFQETVTRDLTGRFIVSLPFKKSESHLGESYSQALRRYTQLENKMSKNTEIWKEYCNFMKDYLESKHMSPVKFVDYRSPSAYYIPHHCVLKPESTSTRLRVVFDASAKTSSGMSLNDILLTGPKLQNDIFAILLNFRQYPIAFTCDIRQMYRQILISPEHRNFQRILWRFSPDEPIQEFLLNTVTYGVSSAPYLAIRTLMELADRSGDQFLQAADVIKNHIYVDDIVISIESVEAAMQLQQDLISLFGSAGFELRKWTSNEVALLRNAIIDSESLVTFDKDEPNFVKVLGLQWNPNSDVFSFKHNPRNASCTKRSILSQIARIYDPLGFLAPVMLFAKQLIQQLWSLKASWDESPPQKICFQWNQFEEELALLNDLRIPRYIQFDKAVCVELHGFSDASQIGYGAVVYFRVQHKSGEVSVHLCCAKSKVAPIKTASVPRLELLGAVLLSNLVHKVVENTSFSFSAITNWCDSEIVLHWLSSMACRWKTFVANRVSHIQELFPSNPWRYVPSLDNPADCLSRGLFPAQLLNHELWWHGPSWLGKTELAWPQQPNLGSRTGDGFPEEKLCLNISVEPHPFSILFCKFSSLKKIQRIIAYMFRLGSRRKVKSTGLALSSNELHEAMLSLVGYAQRSTFAEIIERLHKNRNLPKPYRKLNLFLDDRGLIRVGGRLTNSQLAYDAKHPWLLPNDHHLTNRIVEDVHYRNLHPGYKTLSYLLQQQFWILSCRKAVHKVISKCYRCFRANPKAPTPFMADLPSYRVNQTKAFLEICLDYAGPFFVTPFRGRGVKSVKSYVSVFVCCATKALHLELVSDLSAESFLAAFQRFISRRGKCLSIHSDQGTNFVGAYRILNDLSQQAAVKLEISWHFNPPSGPHFNGLAEAGVKSFKTHLNRVIGNQILTMEEFGTLLTRIEALLNSRPLCPLSSDPNDLQSLTPGHFLLLEPLNDSFPEPDLTHISLNRLSRWQLLSQMHSHFWNRWHVEYLNTLQQRSKWNDCRANPIELNTLVLIKNDNLPPSRWSLGRVERIHPGTDGIIRVATVRTATGSYQRPIVKLCPLPSN